MKKSVEFKTRIVRIIESAPNRIILVMKSKESKEIFESFKKKGFEVSDFGNTKYNQGLVKVKITKCR